jgi:tetratricopeptide (TPR) repeat protein
LADINNALIAYVKAAELDKTNVELIANLASVYGMAGDFKHAIQYFKKAISLKPDNMQYYILISNSYTYMGKPDSARYYAGLASTLENESVQ